MIVSVLKSAFLFRRQKGRLPQTLIFFVTSRCNARCGFCLYYDQVANPVAADRELNVEEIGKIARKYGPLHYLALSGGEPFIRKDLEPLCQAFIDFCGTSVIDIPSNFFYTDAMVSTLEPLLRKNPRVIFDVQASLDHIGQMHDESRKVKNLYQRALESFGALSKLREKHPNLRLKVNVVYLERNRDDLDNIASELRRDFGYDRIQLAYPNGLIASAQTGASAQAKDVEAYIDAADRFGRRSASPGVRDLHSLGISSVKSIYHRLLREAVSNERNVGSYCEAGRHILVINEKGDVFPCEPLWQPIGNLREFDYDAKAVLEAPAYKDFRRQRLGPGKCNCAWSCAMLSHISVKPSFLPRILANAVKTVLGK